MNTGTISARPRQLSHSVPLSDVRRSAAGAWIARIQKQRHDGARLAPTHAILDGIGHPLGNKPRFTIGLADLGSDVALPDAFNAADDCSVPLIHEGGRLWFVDTAANADSSGQAARTPIDAGDRLTVRCGSATAEVIFAHCQAANGSPRPGS